MHDEIKTDFDIEIGLTCLQCDFRTTPTPFSDVEGKIQCPHYAMLKVNKVM